MDAKQIKRMSDLQPILKACLFNLIVYTENSRQTEYFKEVVQGIVSQFSCRVLFVEADLESTENVLSLETIKDNQILIKVSGTEIDRVSFLLLVLFIPDLPVYLLWGQDSTSGPLFPYLLPFATRLIFDSESTRNLERFCEEVLTLIHSSSLEVIDLNWVRTLGWRDVLAQVFDSPERFDQLQTADEIHLSYQDIPNNHSFHPESRALYLQAWLASCLKANLNRCEVKKGVLILHYEVNKKKQSIHLIPRLEAHFSPEEILSIEIFGKNEYTCQMKRTAVDQVQVKADNQFQCELPLNLFMPTLRSGRSFIQEVFYQKMSAHYPPIMELIRLIGRKENGSV